MLYTYTGSHPLNLTYKTKDANGKSVQNNLQLAKGETIELDDQSAFIQSFITRGLLQSMYGAEPAIEKSKFKNSKK